MKYMTVREYEKKLILDDIERTGLREKRGSVGWG